eukprot:CAMPEP_0170588654 /NCGR_PEP_ID=MMETSP0224-20130122/10946_1 /TAXON_ID=285029 /ORGANISM="Togula jolla, Strain CCCM 725" /LENGTH=40 /DNA_ID= /DNA_START= /DNA_END= /DNA_ORIENTATION=
MTRRPQGQVKSSSKATSSVGVVQDKTTPVTKTSAEMHERG